jgi:hypothetical protein
MWQAFDSKRGKSMEGREAWIPVVTLSYDDPDGEPVEVTKPLTEAGLADVLVAMEDGQADE